MHDIQAFSIHGFREPFCSLSHAIGACIFAGLSIVLIRRGQGDNTRVLSLGVMVYSTLQTLALSSIYHMSWPGPFREVMLRADVAGIFFLMAGCFTPVQAILFRGTARSAPLVFAWTTAIGGMLLRTLYFDRLPNSAGIVIFLALGWGGAITAAILWYRYGWRFVRSGVLAGLAYTVGAIVLVFRRPVLIQGVIGPHELWHLAVLCGLALHWNFVFQFAAGLPSAIEARNS